MKTLLLLLSVWLCLLCSTAPAAVSLTVNGTDYETLSLRVGQAVQIEIRSDDAALYEAYLGFDSGTLALGALSNPESYKPAGTAAYFQSVTPPTVPLKGYYVMAAGTGRKAGLHFSFSYTPATVGQTTLKLYDSTIATVLDSILITIEAAETGTGFTYQGRLLDEDKAANGPYDMVFTLFDAPGEGGIIGTPVTQNNVDVVDGYFVSVLDFGSTAFGADARWLQTSVRPSGSADDYTLLWPRQRITPAPQATYASGVDWANIAGIPADLANYTAPDIAAGFVPYYDGTRLISSSLSQSGGNISLSGILNPGTDLQIATEAGAHAAIGTGINTDRKLNVYTDTNPYAVWGEAARASGLNYGLYGKASGNTTGGSYGVHGHSSSASGSNYGVHGKATDASSGTNFGVYGQAVNTGTGEAFAGYFEGDTRITGRLNHDSDLRIATAPGAEVAIGTGIDTSRKLNVYTNTNNYAVYGQTAKSTGNGNNFGLYGYASGNTTGRSYGVLGRSSNASGNNYGVSGEAAGNTDPTSSTHGVFGISSSDIGSNAGVTGQASGNTTGISQGVVGRSFSNSGINYGVRGEAYAPSIGTNYGVYGRATNDGTGGAWAGYFSGDVYASGNFYAWGNVGIGTLSPSRKLFVNGTAGGTSAWFNDSDARLKKDIVTIDGALEKVGKLRGVQFEWKDTQHHAEGKQIGFIAQETVGVVPEVVDIQDGNYAMQYAPLTALLVEAVKEQQKQIEALQAEIEGLKKQLNN
ncbi:MAG: tail fiber domain-containing protein [Phycisphaerae bacterium]|nr:tail fiber domain-containing protein [Phycisphaerae bacterium]